MQRAGRPVLEFVRSDTDVALAKSRVEEMNLNLVPCPAFTPRPSAPILGFRPPLPAAPVDPSSGPMSAGGRQPDVNVVELHDEDSAGQAQSSGLPKTPGRDIHLTDDELEIQDSEPPLKRTKRARSSLLGGDDGQSMQVDLQAAPPSEEIRRQGSGALKKTLDFTEGSGSVGGQPTGLAASAKVSHGGPPPSLETHVSAPLVIGLTPVSQRRGKGEATSKGVETAMEGVDADFPPNAADMDMPNEQLSPTPQESGSPTQPAETGGLS